MLPEKTRSKGKSSISTNAPHERAIISDASQKQCADCHLTCYKCRGPNASDCTECASDYKLRNVTTNESYCDIIELPDANVPKVVKLFDGEHNTNATSNQFNQKTFLQSISSMPLNLIFISVAVICVILLVLRIICVKYCANENDSHTDKKNYAYNRIGYDGTTDHIIMEQDMLAISDSSDEIEPNK